MCMYVKCAYVQVFVGKYSVYLSDGHRKQICIAMHLYVCTNIVSTIEWSSICMVHM